MRCGVKIISIGYLFANNLQTPFLAPSICMETEPLNDRDDASLLKTRPGLGRLLKALGYSAAGFAAAWRHEAAFRQVALCAAVLSVVAFLVTDVALERAMLIAPLLMSLAIELINSAIEATVDRISLRLHPLSKRAKDLGSAAQFTALLCIAVVWSLVLGG